MRRVKEMRDMPRRLGGFAPLSQKGGGFFHLRVLERRRECIDIVIGHADCGGTGNAVRWPRG
ncbi:hypothetical protein [Paraburkholderia phosphatilytica]|uniref:hypothetical protein n=1 Tax=Paraburkholderia phosphatilytica TaxID=2282883 RepID=UPI000F5F161D|nr:hypothetical protein [Paraburkholderia phosphatilytica]